MRPSWHRWLPWAAARARLMLPLLLLTMPLCLQGCGWLHGDWRLRQYRTEDAAPSPPEPLEQLAGPRLEDAATTAGQATIAPGEESRPGNPEAWGDAGRAVVARTFEPVQFDEDSVELDANARHALDDAADWLREHPDVWLLLDGHADDSATLRYGYNVGMARALAAQEYLIIKGIDAKRLYAVTHGADRPVIEAGRDARQGARNRRVELVGYGPPAGQRAPAPVAAAPGNAPGAEAPEKADRQASELPRGAKGVAPKAAESNGAPRKSTAK